jgi:hypothetical protein
LKSVEYSLTTPKLLSSKKKKNKSIFSSISENDDIEDDIDKFKKKN